MVVRWQGGVEYTQYLPWAGTAPTSLHRIDAEAHLYCSIFWTACVRAQWPKLVPRWSCTGTRARTARDQLCQSISHLARMLLLMKTLQGQYAYGLTGEVDPLYGCSAVLPITEAFARKYVLHLRNLVRRLIILLMQKCVLRILF